jgi:hypothetical protein
MDALITDVHFRSAVAGVRALDRAGLDVLAVGLSRASAGRWSRYASARAVAPDVAARPADFAAAAFQLAERDGPLAIYPCREETVDVLLASSQRAPREVMLPYPGPDAVLPLRDNGRLRALAGRAGIRTPATYFDGPAAALASARLPLPYLVKTAAKGGALDYPRRVESPEEVERIAASLPPAPRRDGARALAQAPAPEQRVSPPG